MYFEGQGTPKNYQESIKWFTKSAEQGESDAQFSLGLIYYHGKGTTKNNQEAIKWFSEASSQGHSMAKHFLFLVYQNGHDCSMILN